MDYEKIYTSPAGGSVALHELHGKDELFMNKEICFILANLGYHIQMLPCISENEQSLRSLLLPDVFKNKNPDIRINGIYIGDIKSPGQNGYISAAAIKRSIYAASQQKVAIVVIDVRNKIYSKQDIKKGVFGALQPDRNKSISAVWFVVTDDRIVIIERGQLKLNEIHHILNSI